MPEALAATLGRFVTDVRASPLPAAVAADGRARILDILGLMLAATGDDAAAVVRTVAAEWGGTGAATVVRTGEKWGPASAALLNGTLAHALDFDDTHLPSVLHPSASVVPAALATAEATGAGGEAALKAVMAGIEVCVRLGMASYDPEARNHILFDKGFHATSICGTIGSAAAAALLLDLDQDKVADALGIAASLGSGLIEANRSGGSVKQVHCGWAAHAGVTAAQLAAAGLTGPELVFEGRFGYFNAFSDGRFERRAIVDGLGDRWEATRVFFKPYPTNHFTHAGIDAALALRASGIDPADIERIELGVSEPTLRTIAEPPDLKAIPPTPYYARFSGPFTVAAALVGGGGLGVASSDFTEATISDPERIRIAGLVECFADEEATAIFPNQFAGVLRVTLKDGSSREHRVTHNRGGPDSPLSSAELETKFRLNAGGALDQQAIEQMLAFVSGFEEHDVATIMAATAMAS